jgi:pimeloyl-ACP methyl ester carboxylesterase
MPLRTAIFAVGPVALGAALMFIRHRRARIHWLRLVAYALGLTAMIACALYFVAHIAGARVPPLEIAVVVWFAVGLRLAWEVWRRTVGRAGQRWVRWERRRRAHGESGLIAIRLVPLARVALVLVIFVPAALAIVLTHRFKLADGTDPKMTLSMPYESVRIPTADGLTLDGWFVPCGRSPDTIVICHGAGANKGNFIWFLPALAHRGYNLLMFDFRAHGGSGGRVCTYGLHERRDVLAAVDWLKRARPEQARRVVGLGSSLGSMALVLAAAEEPRIDAVVLDSPFVSLHDLLHHHLGRMPLIGPAFGDLTLWWMALLTGADFTSTTGEQAVAAIAPRPVMIIHGADDVLMPRSHAERLAAAARGPCELWFGPGPHSNIVTTEPEEYAERVFRFLNRGLVRRRAGLRGSYRGTGRLTHNWGIPCRIPTRGSPSRRCRRFRRH